MVHSGKVADGQEIPDHAAIGGRIGAEVSIHRTGEHHARYHRYRSRLRRTAARSLAAALLGQGTPQFFPTADLESEESPARLGISQQPLSAARASQIRQRYL